MSFSFGRTRTRLLANFAYFDQVYSNFRSHLLTNTNTTPTLHMKMNMSDIRGKFNYESWFLKEFEIAESSNVISEVNLTMKVGF